MTFSSLPLPQVKTRSSACGCSRTRASQCLTQRAIDKALPKLHDEDVYATSAVCVRCTIDGLGDMFSRVVAAQVADARSTHSAA